MEVLPICCLSVLFQKRLHFTVIRTLLSFTIVSLSLMHMQTYNVRKGHGFSNTFVILIRDYSLESDKSHYLEWGESGK